MGDLDDGVRGGCWDIMEESGCGGQENGFGGIEGCVGSLKETVDIFTIHSNIKSNIYIVVKL